MPQQNLTDDEFIRQMTVGTPSSDQEADPDVVKDIVRGVQYTPFDVLGAPVDIATMVMRPLGYNVEKPVGGSDYFIDQAAKLGLFKPSTGSGAELLGRIAGGGATPALARGVSKVAGATEDFISNQLKGRADRRVIQEAAAKVPPDTAYDPLRDRMEQIGALTYAIKPKGGNVVPQNIQTSLDNIRPMMAVPGEGVLPPSRMFASSYAARLKDQIEKSRQAGDPTAYLEGKLSAVEPNAALDNWIQTKLSKYVRTDMGSEADPVRKLAEEMSTKVKADYEVGLKRIAKMKSDIAKAKAKNKNTDASETTLAAEIEKVEGAFRQTSLLPAALGPYTHPALRTNRAALAAENREMAGFSPYPISKTNLGKEWEEIADMEFRPHKAGDLVKTNSLAFQENPWIGNLNPDEIVYTVDPYIYQKPMFTHTVDELKNALDPASGLPQRLQLKPEDMQQLSIDKAFRLVNNINDWRLEQRIALNLEEANRAAVTVKQYPGSPGNLQWQEIKAPTYTELPPGYTIEKLDDATSVLKGPDGKSLTYFGATDGPASNHQKEALSFLSKNDLERALKYEGSTMRHCVGGYCDDVWSGRTRTYSLRDSKGEPHVTIETAPVTRRLGIGRESDLNDSIETFLTENPKNISERLGFGINDFAYARRNSVFLSNPEARTELNRFVAAIQDNPEFNQWSQSRPVEEKILQIKGKANEKPIKKYIPFVQDFVLSGKWSSVGDIRNAELNKLDRGGKLLRELSEEGYDISKIPQYVTDEELKELVKILMNFDSNRALKKLDKKAAGGEVSNADFIEQMTVGTRPTDQETSGSFIGKKLDELGISPADFLLMAGKFPSALGLALTPTPAGAGEEEELARLRGLAAQETAATEGGTAKALLQAVKSKNPAAAVKAISEVTKAKPKSLTKKDLQGIASELETSRGQLAEIVKKYPQLRDASIADVEALTKGDPFTAYRGISLLPGRELRREEIPSMTMDPSVALSMIKDAPVMMTKEGFITATPVLRQYPGMQASETQIYVPSLIEQISERQPGALEMKIPTRSGEKMTVADIFKEVKGEKELLADVSKKEPQDVLFNRYQGGVGDRYLMEVARKVLAGKYEGGESLVKEIGGYQTDPKALAQEFDEFAEMVKKRVAIKKAKGGEMTNNDFIRNRQEGSPQEGEVANDDFTQTIDEARTRHVNRALQVKINLYQHGLISLDELATYMPGIDPYNIAEMFGGTDSNPLDKAKSKDIKTLPYSPPKGIEAIDLDELARGDEGMTEEEFNPSRIPDVNRLGELGPYGDFGLPYVGRPLILKNGGDVSNEDFIQQMMTGTPPTNQEADPDVVKDIVRGAQYTPFDLLGAPVDIATMAIRPFGYNVEKPVGGSEYFIDQAAKLGLFKPSTGSAAELLGRIGGGGATPAIARGITKAADATGDFISGQLKGRADRQAVQQAAAKVPPDTAYDPLRDRMEQIGALTYAVKPKGGNVLTSKGSPVGNYIEDVITKVKGEGRDEIIPTQNRDAVEKFIAQKMPKYLAKDFGTETDPIRVALQEGRMATFGEDKQKLRKYSLAAARGGDPEAIFDVTRAYDQGTSLRPYFINPDSKAGYLDRMNVKAKGIDDLVKKIVAEGGDEDAARSALEGYSTTGFRETTLEKVIEAANKPTENYGEGFEALAAFGGADQMEFIKKAAERGDIAYGLEPYHMLKMFNPKEVAETIGAVPSEKLSSMSFPEAFIEGTKALKTNRDFDAVIEIAKKGKGSTLSKEILLFGTKPVKVDVPSGNWIQITDPKAVDLEGRIMGHSVYRYNEPGNQYNLGGKEGFLSGRANIFSLRDEKGLPMVTVEMEDMTKIPNNPTPGPGPDFKVRQVQGKFNSLPEEYVDDVFELAKNLGARWPEGFAGKQTYGADRTGKRLDENVAYEWGKLYEQYKAGKKATGGEITKFIRDNT